MPSRLHDDVDGTALPVGVDHVAAGKVAEVLAVVRVRPQAYGAVGECALAPVNVLLRKHKVIVFAKIALSYANSPHKLKILLLQLLLCHLLYLIQYFPNCSSCIY